MERTTEQIEYRVSYRREAWGGVRFTHVTFVSLDLAMRYEAPEAFGLTEKEIHKVTTTVVVERVPATVLS